MTPRRLFDKAVDLFTMLLVFIVILEFEHKKETLSTADFKWLATQLEL